MKLIRYQYYLLKPYLPWGLRMAVRRWVARRKLAECRDVWPIKPGSQEPPQGWPGWPEGKQFAVILTHDVEGPKGLERVRRLAELEMELGFRSSFNFIPEGDYRVTAELRQWLTVNGFEVGVHDLYHDGKLYSSQEGFRAHARKINYYLKEWNAVGFRSGFMHHNLNWAHDLDIQYDASTFDTDPFEPQPDGVNTIFPFWVPGPKSEGRGKGTTGPRDYRTTGQKAEGGGQRTEGRDQRSEIRGQRADLISDLCPLSSDSRGYVELPYTLSQDSTLFILLRESSLDTWKGKLDWIVEHGGMMLVNVHPDYITFDGSSRNGTEYPSARYREFLQYVHHRFENHYWQVTPREVAEWYAANRRPTLAATAEPAARTPLLEGKKAAVLLYSYYPSDPRPRREAEALAGAGVEVDLICLRQNPSEAATETINGVRVRRVPLRRRRDSKLTYFLQYGSFISFCAALLAWRSLWKRYDLVHAHNMPDILVFSGLAPKLRGAKLILDLHDPMPELMMSIYGLAPEHFLVRLLKRLEKRSIAFADLVLTANIAFQRLFVSRSCPAAKVQVVMNSPQANIFDPARYKMDGGGTSEVDLPFRLMYHGLLVERHGLDTALEAVAQLRTKIPQIEFHIYGDRTAYMDQIDGLIGKLQLQKLVHYHGPKPHPEIAQAIASMHLGLVPNRRNPFTEINMPTRIFEYLAMQKPVVVPRTEGIRDYFAEDEITFFEPGDAADLAAKIEWVHSHPSEVRALLWKGRKVYQKNRWELEQQRFLDQVESLITKRPVKRPLEVAVPHKRICMLSFSNYESDNRVMRYAEELARRGDMVDVLALKRDRPQAGAESTGGVRVCHIQRRPSKNQRSKLAYLLPLLRFWFSSSACMAWRHLRQPYDLVHVHNVPDFLVFAAWLPKLTGAKVILDIHDIVPEFYASKFAHDTERFDIKLLKKVERASARFADHVIISNHLWRDKFVARSALPAKCSVFVNHVNTRIFYRRTRTRQDGKFIILFPGGLQWHQGLDIAIRAFARVTAEAPEAEFHIYGDGNMKEEWVALAGELGVGEKVKFFDPLPVAQIAEVMANADLGVVPKRADSFGNEAYSTKIMEFMALGVPVIISETKIDRYYFDDSVARFFPSGNVPALAEAVLELIRKPERREKLIYNACAYVERHCWDTKKQEYLDLVDNLTNENEGLPPVLRDAKLFP